jgi:hypothetical protein
LRITIAEIARSFTSICLQQNAAWFEIIFFTMSKLCKFTR